MVVVQLQCQLKLTEEDIVQENQSPLLLKLRIMGTDRRIKDVIVILRQSTIYHTTGGRSYLQNQTVETVRRPGTRPRTRPGGEINWNDS